MKICLYIDSIYSNCLSYKKSKIFSSVTFFILKKKIPCFCLNHRLWAHVITASAKQLPTIYVLGGYTLHGHVIVMSKVCLHQENMSV